MPEQWREIPGFNGRYLVSSLGSIKECRIGGNTKERVLSITKSGRGYSQVHLRGGKQKSPNYFVHRLVLLAFVGPSKMQVNHKDGNKSNNCLDNLEYCTDSQNKIHAITVLGTGRGSRNGFARLTEPQVREIKTMLSEGVNKAEIAKKYGVSRGTIGHIDTGACWGWIT